MDAPARAPAGAGTNWLMSRRVRVLTAIGVVAVALLASEHPALAAAVVGVVGLAAVLLLVLRRRSQTLDLTAPLPRPDRIGRILVPVYFSPESALAVDYARALAARFRSQVFVLYVVPSYRWLPGCSWGEEAREIRWRARVAMQAFLRDIGGTAGFQVVFATGTPFAAILDGTRQFRADLIVLGARGAGRTEASVLGRTAAEVVRRAPIPVLTVAGGRAEAVRMGGVAEAVAA